MWKIVVDRIPDENDFWATMRSQILDSSREIFNWFLAIMYQTLDLLCEIFNWFLMTMCQILDSLCEFLGKDDNSDFLNVLGMIGIALLTVIIPLAVAMLTDNAIAIFADRKEKRSFGVLDRNIIFKYIVNAERLLLGIALVYIPILLWDVIFSYPILRIIHLILWGCGVGIMVKVLINVSYWQKGDVFKLRYEYLKNLKNPREMKNSWHSVWEVEDMDRYSEKKFFTIFSSTIDKLLRGDVEKIKIAVGLVDDFNSFIDKRSSAILVIFEENFSKILEWHFSMWEKIYQPRNKKNENILGFYNMLFWSLSSTLKKIEEKELKENAFYFFVAFKSHVEKHKERFVEREQGRKDYYIEEIMHDFFDALVKNIENSKNIWGYFPPEWKITSENIKKRESYVSRVLYDEFFDWARNKISGSPEYDNALSVIAYYLFSHVCPNMWANILTFRMRSWVSDERMKSLVEHPPVFRNNMRPRAAWVGDGEEAERKMMEDNAKIGREEEEETISLALLFFGGDFTQDNLKNYIAELEGLKGKYNDEAIEIRRMEAGRREYIRIFGKLLEVRRKKDAEK